MKALQKHLQTLGLPALSPAGEEKLAFYAARLAEENEKYNLTAITDPAEVEVRHFADSLTPAAYLPASALRFADVGCGAGFPGLPLKIYLDDISRPCELTLMDATGKKVEFLHGLAADLGLTDVHCVQGRAEELGRDPAFRERFDVVLSRAVAAMDKLDELCLPFVSKKGVFIALKSSAGREECAAAAGGIAKLGGGTPEFFPYSLPGDQPESLLVRIHKLQSTPEAYPRAFGAIKKRPL